MYILQQIIGSLYLYVYSYGQAKEGVHTDTNRVLQTHTTQVILKQDDTSVSCVTGRT